MSRLKLLLAVVVGLAVAVSVAWCSYTKNLLAEMTMVPSGGSILWNSEGQKEEYLRKRKFVPKNIIPTRFQIYKDHAFLLTPRYRCGVPFTLGHFSMRDLNHCGPDLTPFPSWNLNCEENTEGIQNAVDIYLDCKDILWVLDIGVINTLSGAVKKCPPKVFGLCPSSGKVVRVISLGSLVCPESRPQYLQVENTEEGETFLYISDAGARSILVWDVVNCLGYRLLLPKVVEKGSCRRDVLYLVLLRTLCGSNLLYFTYLSATKMFYMKTQDIRRANTQGSVVDTGIKPGRMVILGTDNGMSVFFRFKGENDIYMWNATTTFKPEHFILVQRGEDCRMTTHVIPGYKRLMWYIESNFQDFIEDRVGCMGVSARIRPLVKFCDD